MNRASFGHLIDELHERGLELALSGLVILNGISAIDARDDGSRVAPFLHSSLAALSPTPDLAAGLLIVSGFVWMLLLLVDIVRSRIVWRVFASVLFGMIYTTIVAATFFSAEPKTSALRYVWSCILLLLCFLATFRMVLAEKRGVQ